MAEDLTFTFDTDMFEQGIQTVIEGFKQMEMAGKQTGEAMSKTAKKSIGATFTKVGKKIKSVAGKIIAPFKKVVSFFSKVKNKSQDMTKAVTSGLQKFAIRASLVGLALKGIRGILSNMPEIGKAFGIAKDVFFRNLLFPLRQAVFPLLQRLLDWVRDNRVQFVKWGMTLANIFRVVVKSVKSLVQVGRSLIIAFKGFFERIFGVTVRNMQDLFNVFSFRLSVIITFVTNLIETVLRKIEPTLNIIGDIISTVIDGVVKLTKGFVKGFSEINKQFPIMEDLNDLFKSFLDLLKQILPVLEPLGEIIGQVFGSTLVLAFRTLESTLVSISGLISLIKGELTGEEFLERVKTTGIGKFFTGGEQEEKVNDAIITKDGKIIRTSPQDTLIATKQPESILGSPATTATGKAVTVGNITVDFSGMQIILKSGSQEEARGVGETIVQTIAEQLNTELERIGAN